MFRNLSTSAKFLILCGIFLVSLGVATYSLVKEKEIAIHFARKELVGNRYVATVRPIYGAILSEKDKQGSPALQPASADKLIRALSAIEARTAGALQTAELSKALEAALRDLSAKTAEGQETGETALKALATAKTLIARVGDDSNLTLDPDLDSYHLQDIVVVKLPSWLSELADLRILANAPAPISELERKVHLTALEGRLMAAGDDIKAHLLQAYRGNPDGSLKAAVDQGFATMMSAARVYVDGLTPGTVEDEAYGRAVQSAISAWATAQSELDRVLDKRIEGLITRLQTSLSLIGALTALSLLMAFLTYRRIVKPLERLEAVAGTVRETKDYGLRATEESNDEIGRLAAAFNAMLSELSLARARETSEQAELARVSRLTTVGAMTASIAHEVNQPLAAIVANSNAALRWLAKPDIEEAQAALKRIVKDGHRASEVVGSVRAIFKKEQSERAPLDVNELVLEVLHLAHGSLQMHRVSVRTELAEKLPKVLADRVQLQQVLLNLVTNGAEAMAEVEDRERLLTVTSGAEEEGRIVLTVADSGTGIAPGDRERIFEPLFTTKASGMGMGLAICRSIILSHGGRLWMTPHEPRGSEFHLALPAADIEAQ